MTQPNLPPVSDTEAQEWAASWQSRMYCPEHNPGKSDEATLVSECGDCWDDTTLLEDGLRLLADRARDKERLARYEAALALDFNAAPHDVLAHLRRVAQGQDIPRDIPPGDSATA